MFVFLLTFALLLGVIHIIFNYNEKARMLKKIPGPRNEFIVGNGLEIIVSGEELMKLGRKWSLKWKGIFRFWCFPLGAVNIYNPEDIEIVISGMKYNEKSIIYSILRPWLRDGLLVSKGEKWQQRRKLLTPAFHFNILRHFFVILQENSQRLVENLGKSVEEPVDVVPVISEYTLHSICETAMGTRLSEASTGEAKSYKAAIYDIGKLLVYRFIRIYLYFDFIFFLTSAGRTLKKYVKVVQSFTQKVIKDRREYIDQYGIQLPDDNCDQDDVVYKKKRKTAMLDLLLLAEKDGHIDNDGIQEEVDTFMFEGHDTTASGLTFCLMTLANNKVIQDKIVSELQEIFGDSPRPASIEDLSKMKYLECCIKETLRLYPPVHFISRTLHEPVTLIYPEANGACKLANFIKVLNVTEDTEYTKFRGILGGYAVPANVQCHINILDLHRSPHVYKDPLVFDPDRFLPENCVGRHSYAYIPFSAGPRNCIGQKFAMMEMKSAVSEILRKFILRPVTHPDEIEFTADLVLRNVGPVYVTFSKR